MFEFKVKVDFLTLPEPYRCAQFTAAYAKLAGLAALGTLPRGLLLWTAVLWPLQVAWSVRALKLGLGFETMSWMQRRHSLLFELIGLAMLARRALRPSRQDTMAYD